MKFIFFFYYMSEKQEIISSIYSDRAGCGSVKTTLHDAKKKDPSIQMADEKQFFAQNMDENRKPGTGKFFCSTLTVLGVSVGPVLHIT